LIKKCVQNIQQEDRLYINLEPCCHTNKKTPPCTEAIIKSGIKHVVIGMFDPNPAVSGRGAQELRKYGIEVIGPIERAACEWFNRGFVSLMKNGRPWITLKKAQTRTGAIAADDGSKMKITNHEQDVWSHHFLRAKHDAILVGVGTVVSDDPLLTVRLQVARPAFGPFGRAGCRLQNHQPLRIVLDPDLRIPLDAKIVSGEMAKETMIVTKETEGTEEKMRKLRDSGVRVASIPLNALGEFAMQSLFHLLTKPTKDFHGITSLLVEGGRKTWEAFDKANIVDCEVNLMGRQ
jgi:diaminohydroxyphosphoribosylaminopyrimidine deaminase/5-amino-6-(5-phosphoribosylamino)uracil reductase